MHRHSVNSGEPVVCLASASLHRYHLLQQLGISSLVMPMDIDESALTGETIVDYVGRIGLAKARAGRDALSNPEMPVLGADTALSCDGRILLKPTAPEEAIEMLQLMSGSTHQVCTGAAIVGQRGERCAVVSTNVTMPTLSIEVIRRYVATGEPFGKAGSYAIQGIGATLVSSIEGSYSNVVGLPLYEVAGLLSFVGIDVLTPAIMSNKP